MTYVYDASFGHAQITPHAVAAAGADGVILYAGCADTAKNVTAAELRALLDAGVHVGLVIENYATDAIGGAAVGAAQGQAIANAAARLGYDVANCVLFAGYDTDSHPADWPHLLAFMEAFAKFVPVPGFYGDSDAIDFLHARHPGWVFWQSNSTSFSPLNPTPNAHLLQHYNDPRAHGLPVDVNTVERVPLHLMGEDVAITDADIQKIWANDLSDGTTTQPAAAWLKQAQKHAADADSQSALALAQVKAVAADVAKLKAAGTTTAAVDTDALAKAIAAHLALTTK